MASSSAAERSATTPELRHLRGQQVILVFSNQGMGNMTNACVILISMAIFGQTGAKLDAPGSKNVMILSYGFGAVACVVMVLYRFIFLKESQVRLMPTLHHFIVMAIMESDPSLTTSTMSMQHFAEVQEMNRTRLDKGVKGLHKHWVCLVKYLPRLLVGSGAWISNDFAFYGNKLQQGIFLGILFPTVSLGIPIPGSHAMLVAAFEFSWTSLSLNI